MRNPARSVLLHLSLVILGILLLGIGVARLDRAGDQGANALVMAAGVLLLFFCPIFLIRALLLARGRARLLRGEGEIARWRVGPADWAAFHAFDAARSASEPARFGNEALPRADVPAEGVAIIAGRTAILVDGSYHVLRPRGIPELQAVRWLAVAGSDLACLEFALAYPAKNGTVRTALRVPVPRAAIDAAREVERWHAARIPSGEALALGSKTRALRAALLFACAGAAAIATGLAWGLPASHAVDVEDLGAIAPWLLAAAGGGALLTAGVVALIALLRGRAD